MKAVIKFVIADPRFIQIDGSWQGGTQRAKFEGMLPNSPLSVEIRVKRGAQASDTEFQVWTPLDLDRWQGHLASNPPWFEVARNLISTLLAQEPVNLTCLIEGLRVVSGALTANSSEANMRIAEKLNWLARARSLAIQHAPTATLPKLSEMTFWLASTDQYSTIRCGSCRTRTRNLSASSPNCLRTPSLKRN